MIEKVKKFIEVVKQRDLKVEAILLSDVDHILLEHHFVPDKPRNIYSHSKSFTSAMIGVAINDKKLTVDDHLVDFMKDELSKEDYERLYPIRIKDLLVMSSGFGKQLLLEPERIQGVPYGFTNSVIKHPLLEKPGSRWCYSNGDTHLLVRAIEGAYHRNFITLINEKIFEPLGIKPPAWETDMYSHCLGASCLYLNIVDMNKLGRLFLNGGKWNGKQIVDPEYIKECRKAKISTGGSTWYDYQYTYQFWKVDYHDSYRADGMYGQMTFILDDLGLTLSLQCPEDGDVYKVWPALKEVIFND